MQMLIGSRESRIGRQDAGTANNIRRTRRRSSTILGSGWRRCVAEGTRGGRKEGFTWFSWLSHHHYCVLSHIWRRHNNHGPPFILPWGASRTFAWNLETITEPLESRDMADVGLSSQDMVRVPQQLNFVQSLSIVFFVLRWLKSMVAKMPLQRHWWCVCLNLPSIGLCMIEARMRTLVWTQNWHVFMMILDVTYTLAKYIGERRIYVYVGIDNECIWPLYMTRSI